jgi:hypothetical protein
VREGEKIRGELEDRVHRVQTALQQHQTDLATAVRDKENLEISLAAVREEVQSMTGYSYPTLSYPSCVPWSTVAGTTW